MFNKKKFMSLLSTLGEKAIVSLLFVLLAPIAVIYRKWLITYSKKKFKKWEDRFYVSLAQKNYQRYYFVIFTTITMIIFAIFIMFPFKQKEQEFEVLWQQFDTLKIVNDSVYHRVITGKQKFVDNYPAEVEDVKISMGIIKPKSEQRETTLSVAAKEHATIPPLTISMYALNFFFRFR
jgi:hypothetical protein